MNQHNLNIFYWYKCNRTENAGGYQKVYVEKKAKDPPKKKSKKV